MQEYFFHQKPIFKPLAPTVFKSGYNCDTAQVILETNKQVDRKSFETTISVSFEETTHTILMIHEKVRRFLLFRAVVNRYNGSFEYDGSHTSFIYDARSADYLECFAQNFYCSICKYTKEKNMGYQVRIGTSVVDNYPVLNIYDIPPIGMIGAVVSSFKTGCHITGDWLVKPSKILDSVGKRGYTDLFCSLAVFYHLFDGFVANHSGD